MFEGTDHRTYVTRDGSEALEISKVMGLGLKEVSELSKNERGEDNILCSVGGGLGDFIYNKMIL